jgi:hypothetical protein
LGYRVQASQSIFSAITDTIRQPAPLEGAFLYADQMA